MSKVWQLASRQLVKQLSDLRSSLLVGRGLAGNDESFFELDYERTIHDPFSLFDMSVAVDRIRRAVRRGERILVYGDYDADGITATAILVSALRAIGGQAVPYLPHRLDDGYGLALPVLKNLAAEFDLCIAVDCGINNVAEVAWLAERSQDVIIVDHHELSGELPGARAILHPRHPRGHYPWGYLCGAGVAWKLAGALLDAGEAKWLLDLAALGTLADVVPLLGENRAIVRFGLQMLRRPRRPGLQALLAAARLDPADITADRVSWRLIPYLNAAGRMEHPQPALDLLLTTDAQQAAVLAAQLLQYNQERQTITSRVLREAAQHVKPTDPFIFVHSGQWPAGIIGLVAGRLADQFSCPAIVVGSNGKHAVGSARAPQGHNVLGLLEQGRDHLLKLGGHAQAAGFSIAVNKVAHLQDALRHHLTRQPKTPPPKVTPTADAILDNSLLREDTIDMLDQFEPFGEANPKPAFVVRNLRLLAARAVGKRQEHLKCSFLARNDVVDGIGFGLANSLGELQSAVDILFHLEMNEYQGRSRLQLAIQDIAPAGRVKIVSQT